MEPRPPREPGRDFPVFVGAVVVDDQMHVEIGGHVRLDVGEEAEELLMPVARLALREDIPRLDIQGGDERRDPVARVVVRKPFGVAQAHGEVGLRPLQRLKLALLIDAEHERVVGRVEIEAEDIADLLDATLRRPSGG
jgi:hypothetical protein